MNRRSGLGRGLGSLIPSEAQGDGATSLLEVPIADIMTNRFQPREHFDEEQLVALTASIRELGILQPLLVRRAEGGEDVPFELIAGERRLRAAKRAGLDAVPVLVREVSDTQSLEQALVENLHRQDLNPLEEAMAYQQLMEDFGLTQEVVAQRVGKSRSAVANTLRLFQLPASIQRLVGEQLLSAGHARALLGTPDRMRQEELARRVVDEQLSVRAVEELVRALGRGDEDVPDEPPEESVARSSAERIADPLTQDPAVLELEELLSERFDTRVRVDLGRSRGRVVIEFADLEDLERIYRRMVD